MPPPPRRSCASSSLPPGKAAASPDLARSRPRSPAALPARSGVRTRRGSCREGLVEQDLDARQLLALEQLERGAASGRESVDPPGEAELLQGGNRVAAADDRLSRRVGNRLGDGAGARREGLELEGPHRSVPEHGARA